MNIFLGNLARDVTEEDIRAEFAPFGEVTSVSIVKDKYSGQPRGFAFVEMPNRDEGEAAIAALKGTRFKERTLDISESMPRDKHGGGGGGRFGGKRKPHGRR
jgi:RNA recognition motif-containing protein